MLENSNTNNTENNKTNLFMVDRDLISSLRLTIASLKLKFNFCRRIHKKKRPKGFVTLKTSCA